MKPSLRSATFVAASVLLLALSAGCGESSDTAQQVRTVTVTEQVEREAAPAPEPTKKVAEEPEAPEETTADETVTSGKIRVPDVVGEDHQLAQDTMQAAGLYNLAEEDATGQGRVLLMDRNWTTVSQSPAAGSMVNEDQTIVLRAKKDGE